MIELSNNDSTNELIENKPDDKEVRGVILAAGPGLKLDPISTIKPLVCIGTSPLTLFAIRYLKNVGINAIDIVVGSESASIQKTLLGYEEATAGTDIRYISLPVQTASMLQTLVYAISNIEGPLLIMPCDLILEKFPIDLVSLKQMDQDVWGVFVTRKINNDITKVKARNYLIKDNLSDGPIVKDIGFNIPNANYVELGISYFGGNLKDKWRSMIVDEGNRLTYDKFMASMFTNNIAKPIIVDAGRWFDVNTARDKIKAELFLQKHAVGIYGSTTVNGRSEGTRELNQDFVFQLAKTKNTVITIKNNILKNISQFEVIPESLVYTPHFIVTDSNLYDLIGQNLENELKAFGFKIKTVVVPEGENSKSIDQFWRLVKELFALGIERKSIIITMGGGAINNIGGMAASTIFRGVELYHFPTTLLAQLDSAIDIKHGINTENGKNLVGTLYGASKVIVDPTLLTFLPMEHIVNGLSESIKHGLVQHAPLYTYFENYQGEIKTPSFLEEVVRWTIDLKVRCMGVVGDGGCSEMIKDYGHGIGHALEQYSGYTISHGQAIAVGMCISAEIAKILKISTDEVVSKHYRIFRKYGLRAALEPNIDLNDLELMIKNDKTFMLGNSYMGLISTIGELWSEDSSYVIPVDMGIVREAMEINQNKFSESEQLPVLSCVSKG